ncbi:hypothetical protein J4233_00115 [Candidatus Pacearchaeota archaeon]|nr:hypothetical protein [uncultured archaeon]MBS3076659.1 hypothetical protein [Candidatus Pacearchaeota archaeon]
MDLKNYLCGRGVDVSRNKVLGSFDHHFIELNNFYTLKDFYDYESQDFIYSKNLINETKFFRILVKEWMNFCKVGGHIIIEMRPNQILGLDALVKECQLLIGEKGKIIESSCDPSTKNGLVVLKKIKSILEKGDSIDKWSFGILSGGFSDNQIDKSVNSMLEQKIPHFEVIICGPYNGQFKKNKNKNVKLIDFDSTLPWITKKKNIICENAKYENLVVIHDHVSFEPNWYDGMKKYGNYFEVLTNVMHDPLGRRALDWITYGIPLRPFSKYPFTGAGGSLDYADWDRNVNIAALCIIKKSVWKRCPWDERLLLWQAEDMKISGDFYESGIVPRFNPHSNSMTIKKEWGDYILNYKFNKYKLGRATSPSLKILLTFYMKNFIYNRFGVYLKRPDAHNEMQRTFLVPMISKRTKTNKGN